MADNSLNATYSVMIKTDIEELNRTFLGEAMPEKGIAFKKLEYLDMTKM